MKHKILNALLIASSLFGYLEWGGGMHTFLFQAESEIFVKLFSDPSSVLHPFTLLPLAGQALLAFTLFQRRPSKILTYIGIAGIGILLVLMFAIGLMSLNYKILFFSLPFLVLAVYTIVYCRKA